jgi:hypothetical protein
MAESTPTTFNQMVRRRMALDRRSILTTFVDKVAVRDYVREKVGEHVLTQLYAVTDDQYTLARADLPREFVLKVSHASGGSVIVGEHAAREPLPEPPIRWKSAIESSSASSPSTRTQGWRSSTQSWTGASLRLGVSPSSPVQGRSDGS